jgi:hypothetical protein
VSGPLRVPLPTLTVRTVVTPSGEMATVVVTGRLMSTPASPKMSSWTIVIVSVVWQS